MIQENKLSEKEIKKIVIDFPLLDSYTVPHRSAVRPAVLYHVTTPHFVLFRSTQVTMVPHVPRRGRIARYSIQGLQKVGFVLRKDSDDFAHCIGENNMR